MNVICVCKIISSRIFSIFLKILIFLVHKEGGGGGGGGEKAKNGPEWQKMISVALHISGTVHHMIVIYDANV